MKERPILMSGPMVQAYIAGLKWQTRRFVKRTAAGRVKEVGGHRNWHCGDPDAVKACHYGQPGDALWVKETWAPFYAPGTGFAGCEIDANEANAVRYAATPGVVIAYPKSPNRFTAIPHEPLNQKWRPSIFMPRWASRFTLPILKIRIERLQDISEEDARAEGGPQVLGFVDESGKHGFENYREWYQNLWDSINGPGSWAANPWVWVIEFERYKAAV